MTHRKLAEELDAIEADLVTLQARLWRLRQAVQKQVGEPVGFQYDHPNERGQRWGRGLGTPAEERT
jgi:hypothetical protein